MCHPSVQASETTSNVNELFVFIHKLANQMTCDMVNRYEVSFKGVSAQQARDTDIFTS